MSIENIISLFGGLALFLYGMRMMSTGMEETAGDKLQDILQKITSNRFIGVVMGAVITCLIQSSSATTVMVVGFVNSGMMTLQQAVWIIMGANIGTTVTGQLIALDIGALAPLMAFIGVAIIMFTKKPKLHSMASILAGLGILFIGMDTMSAAMSPLRDSVIFKDLVSNFTNPLVGIVAGACFTALIQSSSASVGILQALADSGVVHLNTAVYVLFGQNIGTCITALLASIGAQRNAKRTTVIHLAFNLIGTFIFTIIAMVTPFTSLVESLTPGNPTQQIANMHTIFNIATTLMLIPFGKYLVDIAMKVLPEKENERDDFMHLEYLHPLIKGQENKFGSSEIYVGELEKEVLRMIEMTKENVSLSFDCILNKDIELAEKVINKDEYIDFLNEKIINSITYYIPYETNPENTRKITTYFRICTNIERIGDHSKNIAEYTRQNLKFSDIEIQEIFAMKNVCNEILDLFFKELSQIDLHISVEKLEQVIDDMSNDYRTGIVERMKTGKEEHETCIIYSDILTDFERIGDHCLNIAEYLNDNH